MPTIISVAGDWDVFRRNELREVLAPAMTADRCIIDFTQANCADATFLNELIILSNARASGGLAPVSLVIDADDYIVRRVLQLTSPLHVWSVYDSLEQARNACGETAPA